MKYSRDSFFPPSHDVALMQRFMEYASPQFLKLYRAHALALYTKLADPTSEVLTRCMREIAWESVSIQDFYVSRVSLSQGAFICDIRDFIRDYPAMAQRYIVPHKSWESNKALALVEACFNRGAVVYIPAGVHLHEPLHIQHVLAGYRQQLLLEKVIIIVQEGASVIINDVLETEFLASHASMRSWEYHIGDNAQVSVNYKQDLALSAHDISRVTFWCGSQATLIYNGILLGAATAHLWLDCYMHGTNAHVTVRGACAQSSHQSYVVNTTQQHEVGENSSDLIVKGVVHDHAYLSYTGDIVVDVNAHKTHAAQDNHTILLSSQARARSMPRLQVLTDDVQCAHGSAVGQLDSEHMMYLQARGLSTEQARSVLLKAFFADVIQDAQILERIVQKYEL